MSSWSEFWSTWSTYTLADMLMFSPRTYYRLFASYHADIWPGQLLGAAAGLIMFFCLLRPNAARIRLAYAVLAICWLWVAWGFFLQRYAAINWAANYFAYAFIVEALLLLWFGVRREPMVSTFVRPFAVRAALGIVVAGLLIYPWLAVAGGRPWQQFEMFALAPDPTVVVTLGVLLATARAGAMLLLIPLLWCAITGATLLTMHAPDAWVAPAMAIASLLLAPWKTSRPRIGMQAN